MSALLWAALLSMTPIGELRLGLPVALGAGYNIWLALAVCVLANTLIVPIVYFFLEVIHRRILHIGAYQSTFDKFMEKTRKKIHPLVKSYGALGLILFTAIPFPVTGAYTATLAAWFFGINRWKAFFSILTGVFISGLIVLGVFSGVKSLMF